MVPALETPTRVLVIGGSYGGLSVSLNLLDLCRGKIPRSGSYSKIITETSRPVLPVQITVVDERDGFLHLIGCHLALSSEEYSAKMWTKFADIPALKAPEISCVQGSVVSVDCENQSAIIKSSISGTMHTQDYDFLAVASGLRRVWPTVPQSQTRKKYLAEASGNVLAIKKATKGAVGVEMAAEIKLTHPHKKVTLIHSRDRLLSNEPLPDDFKDRSLLALKQAGVEIILNDRVEEINPVELNGEVSYYLKLKDGSIMNAGHVIFAISKITPTTSFLPKTALDFKGYIKINNHLNFSASIPNSTSHFAIGDITHWDQIKRCGGAIHMGSAASNNIYQSMLRNNLGIEPQYIEYPEHPNVMALAVGKQAVFYGPEEGTTWGSEQMERMFGDDLGLTKCWNHMQLGEDGSVR